jgi:hypothetical protein
MDTRWLLYSSLDTAAASAPKEAELVGGHYFTMAGLLSWALTCAFAD